MENYASFIDNDRLFDFAQSAARLHRAQRTAAAGRAVSEISAALRRIRSAHDVISSRFGKSSAVPAACEWVLDNFYLALREGKNAQAGFAAAGRLRFADGSPVILRLCSSLVGAGRGSVDAERCIIFLEGCQAVSCLPYAELCLFPDALRAALILDLAELCGELVKSSQPDDFTQELAAVFGSLRLVSSLDMHSIAESADAAEKLLRQDPAGVYPKMDESSRAAYRERLARMARRGGLEEQALAAKLLKSAKERGRHIGFELFEPARGSGALYITANVLITLFLSVLCGFLSGSVIAAVLLLLPVSELTKSLLDYILLLSVSPRRLPRLALDDGVPEDGKSICVISVLLSQNSNTDLMVRRLEEFYLANRSCGSALTFGLLADLPASDRAVTESDAQLTSRAADAVERLNARYGGGFYLFTRPRRAGSGGIFSGFERKRGAVLALAELLTDGSGELTVNAGDKDRLCGTKYIVTLDSDTILLPDSARELIGAMLHPLNRPVFDERLGEVVSGHGLIHPRMSTLLGSATATDFARIFAGAGGCEPYSCLCGELYTDLFDRGGFSGKGIIDAEALLKCSRRHIPDGRVLSHDALEGAYLRGGYMSDTELSDSFPSSVLSYYRRQHRWIRGDWQNSPWIFSRRALLPDIERWKLFDSLRRSLVAPLTFAAIFLGLAFAAHGLRLAAWAALLALASGLLISLTERSAQHEVILGSRSHSRLLHGVWLSLLQTALRLWLLPYEAWICLSAAAISLWRMLISHKKLLQWETFSQTDGKSSGVLSCLKNMWFAPLSGLALILLSDTLFAFIVGLFWISAPVIAAALSLPAKRQQELSDGEREYLLGCAGDIWRWFEQFCSPEDNWLPPDNYQEQPPVGIAHRSSPTNIGLALVSALAAYDLGLDRHGKAFVIIENMLATLEKMPKACGHLYNWYDTRTLRPLEPKYISTVDSGNLYASLLALQNGLRSHGRPELADKAAALMGPMDFSRLYDPAKGLLRIGIDLEKDAPSPGCYDLLASEARLTSYLAVAKGDVPRRHWRRLSRAMLRCDGYRVLASWTGTMFEYLMPELFLPLCRESLLYESAKSCLYAQKKRLAPTKVWGISESAFFSLDPALNYRYKANGCGALALKRGQDSELVIAPYASFLALCIEPDSAVLNLKRLQKLGARGQYGFIEAIDYSPARCRSGNGEYVRCYMSHHLGMSLLAAANAVGGGLIRRWFMQSAQMAAHRSMLEEKIPCSAPVLRLREEPAEKPVRGEDRQWTARSEGVDFENPNCCLLSNGVYSVMLSESGLSTASCGEMLVYRAPFTRFGEGHGLELRLDGTSLLPEPGVSGTFMWELGEMTCSHSMSCESFTSECGMAVGGADNGELRMVSIHAKAPIENAHLALSFEPILADANDYVNHPAFWRLGLEASSDGGCLLLRRIRRGDQPEVWLCLACDGKMSFSAQRGGGEGGLSSPLVTAVVPLTLKAGESAQLRFALSIGSTKAEAYAGAQDLLASGPAQFGSMVGACAALMEMSARQVGEAFSMILPLWYRTAQEKSFISKEKLWRYGISGDMPVIFCGSEQATSETVDSLTRQFCLLRSCSVFADLVFLTDEGGEYLRPVYSRVRDTLAAYGLEALLGAHGGIRILPVEASGEIRRAASLIIGGERPERRTDRRFLLPCVGTRKPDSFPRFDWDRDNSFVFYVNRSMPPKCWSNILTNGSFSYLACDSGCGNMWYKNAREMRINRWINDPAAMLGPETLEYVSDRGRFSVFAADDGCPCRVKFGFGTAIWEKELGNAGVRCTCFVPPNVDARVMIIELKGSFSGLLAWKTTLQMSSSEDDDLAVSVDYVNSCFVAQSSRSYIPGLKFCAAFSHSPIGWTGDLAAFLRGEMNGYCGPGSTPAFGAVFTAYESLVIACGCCDEETLKSLCKLDSALDALERTRSFWKSRILGVKLAGAEKSLTHYLNGWAAYQTLACRLMGRCSIYQSGGAIGFRDQLQDAINLMLLSPEYARSQILDCCAHQYPEGDVMHWWHPSPGGDKGVRTRCSDDLLWLVWALCEYVEKTGDVSLCERSVSYVNSSPLTAYESDRYETPLRTDLFESVVEHCRRAVELCIARGTGVHGLMLFGSGDWNDGMDKIGGESVWLTWFFAHTLRRFSDLLMMLCKPDSERYRAIAIERSRAADAAWDGEWYLRGYWPDGEKLGSRKSACCRIDSIAQSWAALCPDASNSRIDTALDSAISRLYDREGKLIRLFDPPFSGDCRDPGYIKSYGAGFRENGGQYTHGAIWLALACLRRGRQQTAYDILLDLLPENHEQRRYMGEPFVISADVYTAAGREGESGWTWYTGSSGWYFRVVYEELLGLRLWSGKLYIRPSLPESFPGCTVVWTNSAGVSHSIAISTEEITVNGEKYDGGGIPI